MASFIAPLAISGLSALGSLFNKPKVDNRFDQTQQNQSNTQFSNLQTPMEDSYAQAIKRRLSDYYMNTLNEPIDLTGYRRQGVNDINTNYDLAQKGMQNMLAARGLSYSPAASNTLLSGENARIGDIARFTQGLPLLERQLREQTANQAAGFYSRIPIGTSTSGSTSSTGFSHNYGTGQNISQPNSPLSSLAETLAYLYGNGAFGNNQFTRSGARENPFIR